MSLALTTADPNRTFELLGIFITREAPLGRNDILPLLLVDSDSVLYNLWLGCVIVTRKISTPLKRISSSGRTKTPTIARALIVGQEDHGGEALEQHPPPPDAGSVKKGQPFNTDYR